MTAKKSDRNQKKEGARLAQPQKDPDKMTLQERKQTIVNAAEQIKGRVVMMLEGNKDNLKSVITMYSNELLAVEDKIEELKIQNIRYKVLLEKNKIKAE